MASSRGSSPPGGVALDHFDESPRSKLRRLLAATGNDSEDQSPRKKAASAKLSSELKSRPAASTGAPSGSESEDEVIRPRGKLAARLYARSKEITKDESTADASHDARERVRRLLRKSPQPAAPTTDRGPKATSMPSSPAATQSDEDDGAPIVRARRIKQRPTRRSQTPEPVMSPTSREASPGLFVTPSKEAGVTRSPGQSPHQAAQGSTLSDSDSDGGLVNLKSDRFQALLARKRAERDAREAEENRKREAREAAALARAAVEGGSDEDDSDNLSDDEGGRKLTQTAGAGTRPNRRAAKKALEDMNRETQRIARNQQLTHEMKTRKTFTVADLCNVFNYDPESKLFKDTDEQVMDVDPPSSSSPRTPSSVKDGNARRRNSLTPPSSPPSPLARDDKVSAHEQVQDSVASVGTDLDDDLPDLANITSSPKQPLLPQQRVIGAARDQPTTKKHNAKRMVRVILPQPNVKGIDLTLESDGEESAISKPTKMSKVDAVFQRVPVNKARESSSLFALRRLAQFDSVENKVPAKHDKVAVTAAELQTSLRERIWQQAKLEKERRLEMLRAKGIIIQTEEEREEEQEQIEDIVAKARREAEELMRRERKKGGQKEDADGTVDPLAWDDDEEGSGDEYQAEDENEDGEDASDVELSGSEDEAGVLDAEAGVSEQEEAMIDLHDTTEPLAGAHHGVHKPREVSPVSDNNHWSDSEVDLEAMDPDAEEARHRWGTPEPSNDRAEETSADDGSDSDGFPTVVQPTRRPKNRLTIVSDDDDDGVKATPMPKTRLFQSPHGLHIDSPQAPTSVLRSATKTFIPGLPVAAGDPAGLGLTQMFAGTMDSQADYENGSPTQIMPTFPGNDFSQQLMQSGLTARITQSQDLAHEEETQVSIHMTQTQVHGFDSLLNQPTQTQASEMIELTQDAGFRDYTPLKQRFVEAPLVPPPHSTIDTVILEQTQVQVASTPTMPRRGRLRQKVTIITPEASDGEDVDGAVVEEDEFGFGTTNAFDTLRTAAEREQRQKLKKSFDAKKTKAKEMVEEQAEESEDDYAGLGGADGEDSDDEDAGSVHEMIDDVTQDNAGDDRKLAAFYAERERQNDEKQVEKLFHDITTGGLRRKRGADYNLSDSDDGGEARKRMKRQQFAKMQRALLADERISKVAENPRNQAFMRTIEDMGSDDDDMDFILEPETSAVHAEEGDESQSQQQKLAQGQGQGPDLGTTVIPNSQPVTTTMRPPPLPFTKSGDRPVGGGGTGGGSNPRRTNNGRKPANLNEIRESLSNLLDDPSNNTIITMTDVGGHSDSNDSDSDGVESDSRAGRSNQYHSDKENADIPTAAANKGRHRQRGDIGDTHKDILASRQTQQTQPAFIDRLSLKRQASSLASNTSSTTNNGTNRLAFAAPSAMIPSLGTSTSSFSSPFNRPFTTPALLRRATTAASNGSVGSGNGTGHGGNGGVSGMSSASTSSSNKIVNKKGAGKRSGISYQARENDRRKVVAENQRRREAKRFKGAEGRGESVKSLFGGGKFE